MKLLEDNLGSIWLMSLDKLKEESKRREANGEVKWVIDYEATLLELWWTKNKLNSCITLSF